MLPLTYPFSTTPLPTRYLSYKPNGKVKLQSRAAKRPSKWVIESTSRSSVTLRPVLKNTKLGCSTSCSSTSVQLAKSGILSWRLRPYWIGGRRFYSIAADYKGEDCPKLLGGKRGKVPKLYKAGSTGTKWRLRLIRSLAASPPPPPPVDSPPPPVPPPSPPPPAPVLFSLAPNGVTVVCPDAPLGSQGVVDGITYTRRDRAGLLGLIGGENETMLASTCTTGVTDFGYLFKNATIGFNVSIGSWDTSSVVNMTNLFAGAKVFNQPIGYWNTSSVTNMNSLLLLAQAFNQPIGNWSTGAVTDFTNAFSYAASFNQPIGAWNTGSATSLSGMFGNATSFNQPIGAWNTGRVTDMQMLFAYAASFNQDISGWNTASVTNMVGCFWNASSFNQPVTAWNVGQVQYFGGMFLNATSFNQPLYSWNTSSAIGMDQMFQNATTFNQQLLTWSTSKVQFFNQMFSGATSFNQYIGYNPYTLSWNVQSATTMYRMFYDASSFNQNLESWNTGLLTNCTEFAVGATAWNAAYAGTISGKTPPLSASMRFSGCGST